jgi:hypothetical protein
MTYQLNQRVKTAKYGEGVIVDFERIDNVRLPATHCTEYLHGDRIGIKLDTPENWPLHSALSGVPYFVPSDIVEG